MPNEIAGLVRGLMARSEELGLTDDQMITLERLDQMFAEYGGDSMEEALLRNPTWLCCENCRYEWAGAYTPAHASRWAHASMRLAICPRCYATGDIFISGGERQGNKSE